MAQIDPWESGSRVRLREDFVDGLRYFRNDDWGHALELFRTADEKAEFDDVYQNRYTSFHGLLRVFMGDRNGVKLCRKAAVGEQDDVEIYYNLALAEHRLGFRESAYTALRHGLRIDRGHRGLKRLENELKLREKRKAIPGLNREGLVNRTIGKLFRGSRKSWNSR
jgi:tetratricopeptide (TPR) repeat protein